MPITVGYWKFQTNGHPTKYLLSLAELPFIDINYSSFSEWFAVKGSGKFDLPNLPHIEFDDGLKLTQSQNINWYIIKKYLPSMGGQTLEEEMMVKDIVFTTMYDLYLPIRRACVCEPDYEENLKQLIATGEVEKKYAELSAILGDRDWFVGEQMTYADLQFAHWMYIIRFFYTSLGHEFPGDTHDNLVALEKRFFANPLIAKFMQSDQSKPYAPYATTFNSLALCPFLKFD